MPDPKIPSYFENHTSDSAKSESSRMYIEPRNDVGGSWAAKFLRLLGFLIIIAGIFVAIKTNPMTYGYKGGFDFWNFLLAYIPYLLVGAFSLCFAELFENIQRIADSLAGMKITKK